MDKAEKYSTRALRVASEKYPESIYGEHTDGLRCACIVGYHQAEKDLEAKYKVLMDYCKGALYHWGVENDDCLAGLAKILEDIDNNKEQ